MRGKAHSDETRAAVIAALLAGQGVGEVAQQFHLDPSVVSRWRKSIPAGELHELATKKDAGHADLLDTYLRETLTTLAVQVRQFREPVWLAKQHAADLAVLHGVACDKAIRLLEALQRGADLEGDPGEP